jgi:maltose alpha-D-glucosyltransferase / alpha-amylase
MLGKDPLWYKDAIIYEVHVRAYQDSDGDGHGDFRGLTQKLDYLQDLGITAVWLLPFYPSPWKDDGYDIADYTGIHPQYGKFEDFKTFLDGAHDYGIRVITELVLNHTSDQHAWFQRARLAPAGSPERDFYVWSNSPDKYQDARIIFKDFEPSNWTWDHVAKAYYWHRFYSHQPDLNFDNPAVWDAIRPVVDFWFDLGVDGMRLDAVPYLYEREGTNCENLPETHQFIRALREHVDKRYPDRMFLAEANQWPEDAVAYFGQGDECHMAFHFPLMPRLFMALHQEDRFPILDILAQTPPIPDNCQWCLFLRNHDELTLEMVTDEERDYMYRAYAQDRHARINLGIRHRLAPLLQKDRRRIELMIALLFSLPGTPVLYYGDEIGMGDNIFLGDRDGVRTPMQWSPDRNAGFSRTNPQQLYLPVIIDPEYHYETINVEEEQSNPSSLLWWTKRLVALRKRFQAFGRGSIQLLQPENSKVLAFIRKYQDEQILVVANLSRFVQYVQLDLREYAGVFPEEIFGRTRFPRVGELPYLLTLSPHGFLWFSLPSLKAAQVNETNGSASAEVAPRFPVLYGNAPLAKRFRRSSWELLEPLLPAYLSRRLSKPAESAVSAARVVDAFSSTAGTVEVWFLVVEIHHVNDLPETILVPLTLVPDDGLDQLLMPLAFAGFARVSGPEAGVLCNALAVPDCCRSILEAIRTREVRRIDDREIAAGLLPSADPAELAIDPEVTISFQRNARSNISLVYGTSVVLRVFRRVEEGVNPDLEIGRYLTERKDYHGAAGVLGYIEYRRRNMEPTTLAVLHRFVHNQGTAWQYLLDQLSSFFERVAALPPEQMLNPPGPITLLGGDPGAVHEAERLSGFLETARLLGKQTAEMHQALADHPTGTGFAPEPFGKLYQRSLYQSMRNLTGRLCERLARECHLLPDPVKSWADQLLSRQDLILQRFRGILDPAMGGSRIRCHGDYHLGQLLFTGKDFVIRNFEGETSRTISERRLKRSPIVDVASMVRSLDYAAQSVLLGVSSRRGRPPGMIRPEDQLALEPWAVAWYQRTAREFVTTYAASFKPTHLLPESAESFRRLLELFLLEKALFEIDVELTDRKDWVIIPLRGAVRLLDHTSIDAKPAL